MYNCMQHYLHNIPSVHYHYTCRTLHVVTQFHNDPVSNDTLESTQCYSTPCVDLSPLQSSRMDLGQKVRHGWWRKENARVNGQTHAEGAPCSPVPRPHWAPSLHVLSLDTRLIGSRCMMCGDVFTCSCHPIDTRRWKVSLRVIKICQFKIKSHLWRHGGGGRWGRTNQTHTSPDHPGMYRCKLHPTESKLTSSIAAWGCITISLM